MTHRASQTASLPLTMMTLLSFMWTVPSAFGACRRSSAKEEPVATSSGMPEHRRQRPPLRFPFQRASQFWIRTETSSDKRPTDGRAFLTIETRVARAPFA